MTHTPQSHPLPQLRGLRAKDGWDLMFEVSYLTLIGKSKADARRAVLDQVYPGENDPRRATLRKWLTRQADRNWDRCIEHAKLKVKAERMAENVPGTAIFMAVLADDDDRVVAGDHDAVAAVAAEAGVSQSAAWKLLIAWTNRGKPLSRT